MKTISTDLSLSFRDYMLPCVNKELFGVECPGCGMQRAVLQLFQGDFIAAFKMYPAIYPLMLLFIFLAADSFLNIRYANKISITLMVTTIVFIFANYILKFI